jgi:hypothetical protein
VNASFKAAIERLADAMLAEMGQPQPDWQNFGARAFRELNLNQITEVTRSNDLTFHNSLKRAVVRKLAEAKERRSKRIQALN